MNWNAGDQNSAANRLQTDAARDPRDGGCQHCGRATTAVPLTDFGLERGQFCPHCGLVDATAAQEIATDGGRDTTDDAADDCECDGLNHVDAGADLECWSCFRERDRDDDVNEQDDLDAELRAEREHERLAEAEERAERALERGDWGVGHR